MTSSSQLARNGAETEHRMAAPRVLAVPSGPQKPWTIP